MRVISGSAKGRKLKDVKIDIRPTSDMVKESIFNIIQFEIEGRRVLDLFAGSGQLGIEALSRGASYAVFVDSNPQAIKLINQNLEVCGFSGRHPEISSTFNYDVIRYLKREANNGSFDIIFIDPPYGTSYITETLEIITGFDKLNTNGIIICETDAQTPVSDVPLPYYLHKEYKYGSTKILRYNKYNKSSE